MQDCQRQVVVTVKNQKTGLRFQASKAKQWQAKKSRAHGLLPRVLAFLIHVLDRGFVDHEVGSAAAIHFEAALVVPLDHPADFLAIAEHDDHWSSGLHLLLIVEIFRVSLLRWGRLAATAVAII